MSALRYSWMPHEEKYGRVIEELDARNRALLERVTVLERALEKIADEAKSAYIRNIAEEALDGSGGS